MNNAANNAINSDVQKRRFALLLHAGYGERSTDMMDASVVAFNRGGTAETGGGVFEGRRSPQWSRLCRTAIRAVGLDGASRDAPLAAWRELSMAEIRLAKASDADALSEMNCEFSEVHIEPRAVRSKLRGGRELVAIASVDGAAAGFACAQVRESICYPTPTAEITEVFVRAACRRCGIATGLLTFLERQLVQRRVTHIHILTGMRNGPAQALYAKFGYQYDKEQPEVLLEKQLALPAQEQVGGGPRKESYVCQFRVSLREVEPAVWRLIEVPSRYSLWDLHVGDPGLSGLEGLPPARLPLRTPWHRQEERGRYPCRVPFRRRRACPSGLGALDAGVLPLSRCRSRVRI